MDIELLTDDQFIRHVEALPLTNLEKSLLGRLKCKIELLDDIVNILEYSEFRNYFTIDHDDIHDILVDNESKLEKLSKIESLIEE